MDISKFNKTLGQKIAIAKSCEKHNDIEAAIKLWIEISEMTLKVSKTAGLDFSYRNMLIKKTQQIVEHIKELKFGPKEEELIMEEIIPPEKITSEQEIPELSNDETPTEQDVEIFEPSLDSAKKVDSSGLTDIKIIEKSDIKNLPSGMKEIETSKDFKIITPHDPNYVGKMKRLADERDSHKTTIQKKEDTSENIIGDIEICFACGEKLPKGAKICSNCGVELV